MQGFQPFSGRPACKGNKWFIALLFETVTQSNKWLTLLINELITG
jgi:hypothetical protein